MDKQKHKLYMAQILSQIFKDKELCNVLGFKGGTALMFFHNLPRFSTDLDFNLVDESMQEISNRQNDNHYEMKTLAGTDIRVLTIPDMFAHKLCAMGERLSPRDIFDVWFFINNLRANINENIIRQRTGKSVAEYAEWCAKRVSESSPKLLMQGLGEVIDDVHTKNFVKTKLIDDTIQALKLFAAFPQVT